MEIDENAPVIIREGILIDAPLDIIWSLHRYFLLVGVAARHRRFDDRGTLGDGNCLPLTDLWY